MSRPGANDFLIALSLSTINVPSAIATARGGVKFINSPVYMLSKIVDLSGGNCVPDTFLRRSLLPRMTGLLSAVYSTVS